MTTAEMSAETEYRRQERIGILLDGRREPTGVELVLARHEAEAMVEDLERQELVCRIFETSKVYQRNKQLERRFGK